MSRKPVVLLVLILGFSEVTFAQSRKIEVHGHRGARGVRPENSMAAFDYALSVGVDVIELDLFATKDEVLVVTHDPYLNKDLCTEGSSKRILTQTSVRSLSLKQLQSFQCGMFTDSRFPRQILSPQKIPTLAEVFEMVLASKHPAAKSVRFNIEMKTVPPRPELTPSAVKYATLLLQVAGKYKLTDRIVVQSFDYRTIAAIKKQDAKVKTAQLTSSSYLDFPALAQNVGANIMSPEFKSIDKAAVDALRNVRVKTIPWTANEPQEWDYLVSIGVDGIITDFPKELIEYLKQKRHR